MKKTCMGILLAEKPNSERDIITEALKYVLRQGSRTVDVERRVYFVSEVAEILGVSRQTVLKYIKSGIVPGLRVGGRYLIMKDEFETFLRSGGGEATFTEEADVEDSTRPITQ
ncbi:helix-turn-helix domain-containing protein [Gemmatimonadota bacterium]